MTLIKRKEEPKPNRNYGSKFYPDYHDEEQESMDKMVKGTVKYVVVSFICVIALLALACFIGYLFYNLF